MSTKATTMTAKRNGHTTTTAPNAPPTTAPLQPVIRVENVERACAFYQKLGFTQTMAVPASDGSWAWANLQFGASAFQVVPITTPNSPNTKREKKTRKETRGLGVTLYCNVPNVDAIYNTCRAAGLEFTSELHNEFWGDRAFTCIDAFGYEWMFGETVERLTPEQMLAAANPH
ncbi:MAG TPA: VOC family protein [Candidatus Thermoplasmatota archaeon]|nr:VOC family protein [Candidatus Thermoplasmatota archaeon]